MPLPVIPQLERSRQKAARENCGANNSSTSTAQPSTLKYIPPAQRCPMTLASRCDQISSPLLTNHPESPGVLRHKNNDLRSTIGSRSRSSESSRSSKSASSSGGRPRDGQPASLKLTASCDQVYSPSSRKYREFQGVLPLKKDEQKCGPMESRQFVPLAPESSVSDSSSRGSPVVHKSYTEVKDGADVWKGRRKGGNRAPQIEPEGTKTWRKPSFSSDRTERESQESSRDYEEQNRSTWKDTDFFRLEPRFEALCRANKSKTRSSSVSLESELSEFEPSDDDTPVLSPEQAEREFRSRWIKCLPQLLRGRSRFFPNTLSEKENLIRNFKQLCKEWNIDPAIHLEEILSC